METVLLPLLLFYYNAIGLGNYDKDLLRDFVIIEARMYGVDPQLASKIVQAESGFNNDAIGDTHLKCRTTGKPMRSRGLWQWNTCGNSHITDKMAFDPIISTNLALEEIKKNGCKKWSNCKEIMKALLDDS